MRFRPDDIDEGTICFMPQPMCYTAEIFGAEDALTPSLELSMLEGAVNEFEITFFMFIPNIELHPMSSDELLRYLDYGLPWELSDA